MQKLADNSVDAIVTDPPYGLSKESDIREVLQHWLAGDRYEHSGSGFMGKSWDSFVPGPEYWQETYRVLKPGGHMLAFGGTRTHDMLAIAIRLAGFEYRETILWIHGQGFPKSKNLGNGMGTNLKPAHEPIILARKPLAEKTIAQNVLVHGTGGINIDATRIGYKDAADYESAKPGSFTYNGDKRNKSVEVFAETTMLSLERDKPTPNAQGRWPSNILLSHTPECVDDLCVAYCPIAELDRQSGYSKSSSVAACDKPHKPNAYGNFNNPRVTGGHDDAGSRSRYFQQFPPEDYVPYKYVSKASRKERTSNGTVDNNHPCVKSLKLCRWLIRLITPPNGVVLDMFCGSGSILVAALQEHKHFIGIDEDRGYCDIAHARLLHAQKELKLAENQVT
jgi:DNA modification methylase